MCVFILYSIIYTVEYTICLHIYRVITEKCIMYLQIRKGVASCLNGGVARAQSRKCLKLLIPKFKLGVTTCTRPSSTFTSCQLLVVNNV